MYIHTRIGPEDTASGPSGSKWKVLGVFLTIERKWFVNTYPPIYPPTMNLITIKSSSVIDKSKCCIVEVWFDEGTKVAKLKRD